MPTTARTPFRLLGTLPRKRAPVWAWVLACALATTAVPSHAFWGLLGKAASTAGKGAGAASKAGTAAATAGKAGTAGVAAVGGAELLGAAGRGSLLAADDAARLAGKAPLTDMHLAANAALPPEVAHYLSRPATALTTGDTGQMMQLYNSMVAKAGKTGDFTVLETMPSPHAAKAQAAPTPAPPTSSVAKSTPPAAEGATAPAAADVPIHALRLLAHASHGGNTAAQSELRRQCQRAAQQRTDWANTPSCQDKAATR